MSQRLSRFVDDDGEIRFGGVLEEAASREWRPHLFLILVAIRWPPALETNPVPKPVSRFYSSGAALVLH